MAGPPHGTADLMPPAARARAAPRRLAAAARRRPIAVLAVATALALVPWIALYVGDLPERHTVRHWNVAWIGFDVLLAAALLVTAWAAACDRLVAIPSLVVSTTLLVCDAWFDVITSLGTGEQALSLAAALAVNLPLAVVFAVAARRLTLRRMERMDAGGRPPR